MLGLCIWFNLILFLFAACLTLSKWKLSIRFTINAVHLYRKRVWHLISKYMLLNLICESLCLSLSFFFYPFVYYVDGVYLSSNELVTIPVK